MMNLFKLFITRLWEESKRFEEARVEELKRNIEKVEERKQKIVKNMASITVPEVLSGLQDEWNTYDQNKLKLTEELETYDLIEKKKLEDLIDTTSSFFISPQKIFDLGNKELQKMMMSALFGRQIFYSKEQKARTPEKSLLNQVLSNIPKYISQVSPHNEKNGLLEHHFSQLLTGLSLNEYASNNFI